MKPQDLPEQYKKYTIVLTDKSQHMVTGKQKDEILTSEEAFIQLGNKTIINKNYIIAIHFDKESTTEQFFLLPEDEQKKIISAITL